MARADITLREQMEKRKNWKKPLVDAVVATLCYRQIPSSLATGAVFILDEVEWLLTKRVRGAEPGQLQAHHGGFMEVTDGDIYTAASRELSEETGYSVDPSKLKFLTMVGPEIYRSELGFGQNNNLLLTISDVEAEPTVGFALSVFVCDVGGMTPYSETDGEVKDPIWMTARQIVTAYGSKGEATHSQFNYFQILLPALLSVAGKWTPGGRMVYQPGQYLLRDIAT
jgi:8-oxo-dGTP pyrophosphatase MutT (NUDIX family)